MQFVKKKRHIMVICNNKTCKATNINYILAWNEITKRLDIVVNISVYVFINWRLYFNHNQNIVSQPPKTSCLLYTEAWNCMLHILS